MKTNIWRGFVGGAVVLGVALVATVVRAEGELKAYSEEVLLGTYGQLEEKSEQLLEAVKELTGAPEAAKVTAAREAWVAARGPWERSEAFLFGPVDSEGHDPELDSWPVNIADLNKVAAEETGPATIDGPTVEKLGEGEKGFHAIEFLLFSDHSGAPATPEVVAESLRTYPRKAAYLVAVTEVFKNRAAALAEDYRGDSGFAAAFANAGSGSDLYKTKAAAYEEIVNGMIGIADESANEKLLAPVEGQDATLLESRFSGNTAADVLANIDGISLAYQTAIAPRLKKENASLNEQVEKAIAAYRAAVEAIPTPLRDHLKAGQEATEKAAEAGVALRNLLEGRVLPLVQNWS